MLKLPYPPVSYPDSKAIRTKQKMYSIWFGWGKFMYFNSLRNCNITKIAITNDCTEYLYTLIKYKCEVQTIAYNVYLYYGYSNWIVKLEQIDKLIGIAFKKRSSNAPVDDTFIVAEKLVEIIAAISPMLYKRKLNLDYTRLQQIVIAIELQQKHILQKLEQ